jgi:8-oxo-dGTP pyrophosphatase MutT (NUDIX family)
VVTETEPVPDRTLASEHLREIRRRVGTMLLTLPSVTGMIRDSEGRLLVVQHRNGSWGFPGGAVEPLELPAAAVVREVLEETALSVEPVRVLGVFGGPSHHVIYRNGDQVSYVSAVFECRLVAGAATPDGREILATRWVSLEELTSVGLSPLAQTVADHLLLGSTAAGFQSPESR